MEAHERKHKKRMKENDEGMEMNHGGESRYYILTDGFALVDLVKDVRAFGTIGIQDVVAFAL